MKKSNIFKPLSLLVLLAAFSSHVNAAPYGPEGRETKWVQPGGETLVLRVFGDEYHGRTETPEGFTVVHNPAEGAYYYAELNADGQLVPTATPAHQPAPEGQAQHLDLPKAKLQEIIRANRAKYDGDRAARWSERVQAVRQIRTSVNGPDLRRASSKIQGAPITGNKLGLTILVQFPDDSKTSGTDPVNFPAARSKMVRFCNEVGYSDDGNSGSVRDYFFDQSLGDLVYTQNVTQIITVPKARNYYNFSDYPANKVLRGDASRVLITDAVTVLKASGFDFTGLTVDANNHAVATNVFFAGPDSGVYANGLWPQSWSLAAPISVGTGSKPVFIDKFQITNAENSSLVIGTFCHENGHLILGYPDIYSNFPDGEGVGEHCLMGSGNYLNGGKTPSPINAYFKDIVGWGNITDIAPTAFKTAKLPTKGNIAYRLPNPSVATEFFMVENRGDNDKWAKYSDDKGILIWHIDETIDGNNGGDIHYGVALEQADGRNDLENGLNRGDSSDCFDLSRPKFNDTTSPNARWWDGTRSGVKIQVLTDVGPSTSVLFGGVPPNTIIVGTPNGGEVAYVDSTLEISWQANIAGNVKIDLYKGGVFKSVISLDQRNDGVHKWAVPVGLAGGTDYTVRISSISNPVPTFDSSDAPFEINDTTFPADGRIPYGWHRPSGAVSTWEVTKSVAYEGAACLVSLDPGDGARAAIAYRAAFKQGNVSFYMRVSSEQGYDFARFYIDGVLQAMPGGRSKLGISGKVGWTFATFPVSKGKHTFTWTYEKDDSYAGASDKAWLDGVSMPATTQEVAVANSKGLDLVDGESKTSFPDVTIGSSSGAKTFTIKNVGKAALTGLKTSMGGTNSKDFTVQSLKTSVLDPGESTTFKVVFSPINVGRPLTASVRISSNDENENTFDINLEGTGRGIPKIAVFEGRDSKLKDGDGPLNFGFATVGTAGKTKTFTIKNQGSATLLGLKISRSGFGKADFVISPLGQIKLGPGATTTVKVTFQPTARDERRMTIQILSNDKKTGPFDLTFSGIGAPKAKAASAPVNPLTAEFGTPSIGRASQVPPVTTVEVFQGRKYLALTVTKQAGVTGTVEVSPNLLDWFSGKTHTSILIDDATTLKVRDNTPVTLGVKRFIRFK